MIYVIDVLLGKEDERIIRFAHDKQSTFGIGGELSKPEWQNIFRQLVSQNLLMVDVNEHNGIKITEKGFLFLKEKETISFRKLSEKQKTKKSRRAKKAVVELDNDVDQDLYENLRATRQQIAKKRRLPAYVIFHDKTLIELAKAKPQNLDEMLDITGIGESKLRKFGQELLNVIIAA
jgi:ATP-dependent DNA helicase RecQ